MSILLACALLVTDGDTVRCGQERIRLANIDTPEMAGSSRCSAKSRKRLAGSKNPAWCDHRLAIRSRDTLKAFVTGRQVYIQRAGHDRYNRTLAKLTVNGQDAGAHLISLGLARPWR